MMDIQEDGSIALRGTSSPWAAEVESLKRHKKKKSSKEDRAGRRIAKGMRRLKDTNEELSKSLNTSKQLRQVSFRNSPVLNERNSSEESPGKIIRKGMKNTIDWDSNTDGLLKDDVSPVRSVRKKTRKLKENVDDSISPVGNVKKKSRTLKENIDDSISPVRSARKKSRKLKENDDSISPVRSERKKSRKLKENIDDSVSPVRSERKISRKLKENIDESISPVRSERKISRKLKENVDSISPVGSARKSRKLKENVDDSISSVRKSIKTKENIECADSSQSPELKRIQSFLRKFDESLLSPVALDNESLPVFENSLMRNTRKVDLLANESNFQTPPSQRILRSSMCGSGRQSRSGSAFKKSIIKTPYRSQVFENETPESVEECVDCDADDVTVQNTKKNKTRCSVICISDDSISEASAQSKSKNRKSKRVMVLENNHKSRIIEERNKSKKLRASKSALQEDHFSISDVSSSDSNERPVKRKSRKIRKSKRASLENARKSWVISVSDSADEGAREGGREAGFDVESAEKSSEEDFETSGAKNSAVTKGTEKHAGNGIFEMEADFDETSKKSKDRTFEIQDVKTSKLKKRTSGIEENSEDIADKTSKSRRRTSEIEEDSTNIAVKKSKSKKRISETEKNSADVDVKASKSKKRTSNIEENSADIVDKASKSKDRTFEIEEDCANIASKSKKRTSEIEENSADTKSKNNTSEIEENSADTKSKNNTFEIEDNSADIEVKTFKSKKRNTKIVENCANVDFSTSKSKNRTFEIEEDSAIDVKTSSLRSSKIEENSPDIDFKASKSKNTTFEIEDDSANIDVKTAKTKKRISKIEDNSADIDVRRSISKASKKDLNNRTFEKEAISENKNDTFEIETSDNKKADEKNDTFEIQDVNNETADENGTFDVNDKETKLKPDSISAKNKTIDKNSTFEIDSTAANNKTVDKNGTFEIDTNVSRKNLLGVNKKPKKRNSYDNNDVQKIAEHPPKKSPRLNVKTTPVNRRSNKMNKTKSLAVIVKRRTLENAKTEKSDSINKNVKQTEIITKQDCEIFDSKRLDAFENVIGDEKSDNQDRTSEIGPKVKTSAISFKERTCEISPEKKTNEIGPEKRRSFEFSPSSSNNVGMKRGCNGDDEPAIPQTMSNFKDTSILSITDSPASNAKRRKRWDVASSPWKNDLKNLSPKEKLFQKPKPLTPIVLDKINATKSTSQVKKSANKVPNYALIHQRAFAKMESVDDYMERKKARAEALRSGTKVKVGILKETPNKTPRSMKQLFPTSTTKLQENKTGNVNLLPAKAATPGKTPNALKIQDNIKSRCNAQLFTSTPNETDKLVGISKMKASRLPRLSNPKNKSNSQLRTADKVEAQSLKNTSKSVSNKSGVKNLSGLKFKSKLLTPKKFVFTQKKTSPVKRKPLPAKEVRIEEVKAVINKTRANIQNPANNRREYIKGVRSNKRFDLLMSMRKMD